MTVMENFNQGLLITAVGMGLIFLTLLLVMALIFALDRLFGPSEKEAREEVSSVTAVEEMAPDFRGADQKVTADLADEAAAIAVAIALQEAQRDDRDEEELSAEVIMVNDIAVDSGAWRAQGRLTAIR